MLHTVKTPKTGSINLNEPAQFLNDIKVISGFEFLIDRANIISNVFDLLTIGIMVFDTNGEVRLINRYASEVLRAKDGLYFHNDSLKASSRLVTSDLKSALQAATNNASSSRCALSIPRPSGLQPLLVLITSGGEDYAVVYIADSERKTEIQPKMIADLFGLTPAESAVAAFVTQGERISDIAVLLNISIHTARCHLKRVFSKTGTERQAELANLIGCLLGKLDVCDESETDEGQLSPRCKGTVSHRRAN